MNVIIKLTSLLQSAIAYYFFDLAKQIFSLES